MMELPKIQTEVEQTCLEVGEFIRNELKGFSKANIEQKEGFNNLVSYVDKTAEKQLVEALRKILPSAGFITEEGTVASGNEAYKWIIDPLDGTTNFVHGLPIFAISIALAKNDKVELGIVYEINHNELFSASKGEQARCNGKEIKVSAITSVEQSLFATGFPYLGFDKIPTYLNIIQEILKTSHGMRRMGSAAVDLAYVACGRFEGFFEYDLNPWDVAAGAFIVEQAGGKVTDFKGGNDFLFGREMCAACAIHPEMLKIIQDHWK
jgi:myo-inositol-1(or 4)-monophosphatase